MAGMISIDSGMAVPGGSGSRRIRRVRVSGCWALGQLVNDVASPELRVALVVSFKEEREVRGIPSGEAIILEVHQNEGLTGCAGSKQVRQALGQEAGLATAAHADHRECLSWNCRQSDFPARKLGDCGNEGIVELLGKGGLNLSFQRGGSYPILSFLKR